MQQYLVTIDIGTTSTKTLAFDTLGNILFRKSISYEIISASKGLLEQDPKVILNAVVEGLKAVVAERGAGIMGVSFSSAMHSLIIMDSSGRAITNSITWGDSRSESQAGRLRDSELGLRLYQTTGTPIHPMSPLCKIEWFKDNEPSIFKRADKFISIKEYIFFHFFGEYVVDYSIASATGLFDIFNLIWNKESLDYLGISETQLSTPKDVTFSLTKLNQKLKQELNIPSDIPFILGGSDGCLANLGSNSIKSGYASITIGTSGAIRMACNSFTKDTRQRVFNYLLDKETFIVGGAINNGAIILEWYRNNFYDENSAFKKESLFEVLDTLIKGIPPGSDGLIFLPFLLGERAPIWDSQARGVFLGVGINHTKHHFLRAMIEGVVYSLYSIGCCLEELSGEIKIINVGGGFANSKEWVQILADVFNKKVVINNSLESSSLGAAMIGFKALGIYKSYREMEHLVKVIEEYRPKLENHLNYVKYFDIYNSIYLKHKDDFKKLLIN